MKARPLTEEEQAKLLENPDYRDLVDGIARIALRSMRRRLAAARSAAERAAPAEAAAAQPGTEQ